MSVIKIIVELDMDLVNDLISAFNHDIIDTINMENTYHARAFNKLEDILRPHKTTEGRED